MQSPHLHSAIEFTLIFLQQVHVPLTLEQMGWCVMKVLKSMKTNPKPENQLWFSWGGGVEISCSLAGYGSIKERFILYESLIFLHSKALFCCVSMNDCMIDWEMERQGQPLPASLANVYLNHLLPVLAQISPNLPKTWGSGNFRQISLSAHL